ncbi:aado/keto reductase [Gloeophyllum trabeum ATCC 11539]|uniref:Aado/keto reductase n=1 Tax=Gloeophyllum trabeum (strain ATCC 11539 / FP-39264 / Madison 617) TaxID=670483 RepID=S7QDX9_GLOTA|nr:aldo/keto reductase [Gloeophyllum trabeum ATCC 11539]EPQ57622.1 aado/keto reductase [Gloeophyllum trabeum ATCC 11539]
MSFPSFRLNNGLDIPGLGIGCWMGYVGQGEDQEVTNMVLNALKVGYRHIDTVRNERAVGIALREAGIPREHIFVTTKLTGEHHACVAKSLQKSLDNLGLDYVDLFLMHWPQALKENGWWEALKPHERPTFVDTWRDMEKLLPTGKVKSIGVSNFSMKTLEVLLKEASVVPAVNQVELHPLLPQLDLLSFCSSHGILLTAYSPLGKHKPMLVEHPSLQAIVQSWNEQCEIVTPAQVLLSWSAAKGIVVVPKCRDVGRMKENMKLVNLTDVEIAALDGIHTAPGMHRSVCGFHTRVRDDSTGKETGGCFGWTYEQLGWDMMEGGVMRG